ncbi:zinc-finger of the MIZ type in Nse subunit-domain-containing protein [Elsinoe ampelina]|uniref:Zinc-finger of the MIZ type in Nse subunit-domain-containing protein n=1 Tax=Elsinoe ampelina TaxID=302913 RepID=A0A6A6GNU4_9PEZI|nr:zinc-finger of the MIZ type in Nse subunit-domain-containing protein [Elsinoe ampelina]
MPGRTDRSGRQSGGTQSTQTQGSTELPEYEPAAYPLTSKGKIELNGLLSRHPLQNLEEHITQAIDILTENVGAVNDNYHTNLTYLTQRKARLAKLESKDASADTIEAEREAIEALEEKVNAQKEEVDKMTAEMEKHVRKMIDTQAHLSQTRETLSELARSSGNATQSSHHHSNSDDEDPSTFDPTDPSNTRSTPSATSYINTFRTTLTSKRDRYASHSLKARYSNNNSYREFYRLRHDAQHPDGTPVPHQDTWFPDPTRGQPGDTAALHRGGADDDDDDDLAIVQENIPTRCQITMREFTDPVTAQKCHHSFERAAILELIDASSLRAVRCPLPGCEQIMTQGDLYTDRNLVRKIKRQQEMERRAALEEDEEEGGGPRGREAVELSSGAEGDGDEEEVRTGTARGRRVKGERRTVGPE